MDTLNILKSELNNLKEKDIEKKWSRNPWFQLWLRIVSFIDREPNKLNTDEELKELVLKFRERFEKTKCSDEYGTACYLINKGLKKIVKDYNLKYEVQPLMELAAMKVPKEELDMISSTLQFDPIVEKAVEERGRTRRGGKKRKTKKRKKSKKLRKKNKRKTRKGGAAAEPTPIPSLAALAAKKINNKEDLEHLDSLSLGDEGAINEIKKNLSKIKLREDAIRVSRLMRSQKPDFTSGLYSMRTSGSTGKTSVKRPPQGKKNPE
tara:strand:+ start:1104 stop:1895 length:792 start_codon:yes stop_codon:yes gene_type:complete